MHLTTKTSGDDSCVVALSGITVYYVVVSPLQTE